MVIRTIDSSDNAQIENIIKTVLIEHNANLPGTAFFDEQLGRLNTAYQEEGSVYYVAELDGKVVGGAGIGSILNGPNDICELQKIYLSETARGKGIGAALLNQCLTFAKQFGYKACYLETMPQLVKGLKLYEKMGFSMMDEPLGDTSHHACNIWMIKQL
ncbi:GNAT family N-acetyltransferase [Flammeovirga sp. SubArs3]|uniref:GNAT family N-acetyltransferase n=1 Tax=Flammeovirga sp. SubArs3 TaxID=2995316 RepID=UPI00248AD754|nr:GNAT family N-acetyltransferase [Flammeovirga sp. SubArs3]